MSQAEGLGVTERCQDMENDSIDYELCHLIVGGFGRAAVCPELTILRLRESSAATPQQDLYKLWPFDGDVTRQQVALRRANANFDKSKRSSVQQTPTMPATPQPPVPAPSTETATAVQTNPRSGQAPAAEKPWEKVKPKPSYTTAAAATAAATAPKDTGQLNLGHIQKTEFPGENGVFEFRRDFNARQIFEPLAFCMDRMFGAKLHFDDRRNNVVKISPYYLTAIGGLPDPARSNLSTERYNDLIRCIVAWFRDLQKARGKGQELTRWIHDWRWGNQNRIVKENKQGLVDMRNEFMKPSDFKYEVPLPPHSAYKWCSTSRQESTPAPAKPMPPGLAESVHNKPRDAKEKHLPTPDRHRQEAHAGVAYRKEADNIIDMALEKVPEGMKQHWRGLTGQIADFVKEKQDGKHRDASATLDRLKKVILHAKVRDLIGEQWNAALIVFKVVAFSIMPHTESTEYAQWEIAIEACLTKVETRGKADEVKRRMEQFDRTRTNVGMEDITDSYRRIDLDADGKRRTGPRQTIHMKGTRGRSPTPRSAPGKATGLSQGHVEEDEVPGSEEEPIETDEAKTSKEKSADSKSDKERPHEPETPS